MNRKITLILFLIGLGVFSLNAQSEKFKALFLYNFTKYIEWPASLRQGDFIIGIIGNPSLAKEMETIASKQKVGNQTIVIKVFASTEDVDNCQILYLGPGKSSLINAASSKLASKSVLLVTDKAGMAQQGAAINFIMDGDRIKFEINKKNIDKYGLTVTSSLMALGTVVQ